MNCPKCGSENVQIQREALSSTGTVFSSGTTHRGLFSHHSIQGMGTGTQRFRYHTTALCHDCGYSWHPTGQDEENNRKAAKGCLALFIVVLAVIILIAACFSTEEHTASDESSTSVATASAVTEGSELWAISATPLEDFEFELQDGILYLERYNGNDKKLRIAAQYESNGSTYPVSVDELSLLGNHLESVILEDGITSVNRVVFNSTGVQRVYLPASLTLIYDDMLAYISSSLELIAYGGSEEDWNSVYQHYQAPSVEEAFDEKDYEDLGSALASDLNNAIGHNFDISSTTIQYNVSLSSLTTQ